MTVKINVLAGWLCYGTSTVIGFFLLPFILGTIGDDRYGTWLFLSALAGYSSLLYLGLGEAISRFVALHATKREWDRLNEVVGGIFTAYVSSAVLALLGAVGVALVLPWLRDWGSQSVLEIRLAILVLGLNAALSIAGSVNGGVLYGIQRFDIERGIQIVGSLVRLGLTLALLGERRPVLTLALVFTGVTVAEQALYFVSARRLVPTLRVRASLSHWRAARDCFHFAAYSGLGLVATKVIYETDCIVIGFCLGPAAIVPYTIGMRLCEMIRAPIRQIGEVFLPKAGELQATAGQERLRRLVTKGMSLAFVLSGGFLIGSAYFGELLIRTWVGPGYPLSWVILMILVSAQVVALPVSLLHMVLLGTGDARTPSLLRLAQAGLNLLLSLVLVWPWGIVGVAMGTLFPVLVLDLCGLLPYATRRLELPVKQLLRETVMPNLAPLAALWAYSHGVSRLPLPPGWGTLLGVTAGGVALLGAAVGARELVASRMSVAAVRSGRTV